MLLCPNNAYVVDMSICCLLRAGVAVILGLFALNRGFGNFGVPQRGIVGMEGNIKVLRICVLWLCMWLVNAAVGLGCSANTLVVCMLKCCFVFMQLLVFGMLIGELAFGFGLGFDVIIFGGVVDFDVHFVLGL
eukprot:gene3071-2053_t